MKNLLKILIFTTVIFGILAFTACSDKGDSESVLVVTKLKAELVDESKNYVEKEKIYKTDIKVTATYNDKTEKDVTISSNTQYNIDFPYELKFGKNIVEITYAETVSKKSAILIIDTETKKVESNDGNQNDSQKDDEKTDSNGEDNNENNSNDKDSDKSDSDIPDNPDNSQSDNNETQGGETNNGETNGTEQNPSSPDESTNPDDSQVLESSFAPNRSILEANGDKIEPLDVGLNKLLADTGIGYGYDVINSKYYSSSSKKINGMILNTKKLTSDYIVKVKNADTTKSGETIGDNQKDYVNNYAKNLDIPVKLEIKGKKVPLFTTSLAFELKDDEKEQLKTQTHQVFYTFYDYRYPYYYQLIDISLIDYLSDEFKKDIMGQTALTKYYFDNKDWYNLSCAIIEKYGTHVITGVQYGGRYEYKYAIASDSKETLDSIKEALTFNFKLEIKDLGNTNISDTYKTEVYETLKSKNIAKTFSLNICGGDTYLDTKDITFESVTKMRTVHGQWLKGMSGNEVALGLTPYGVTAIWNLIPEFEGYIELKDALKDLYTQMAEEKYEELEGSVEQ